LAVERMVDGVSIAVQSALKKIGNPFLVFNEQNTCGYWGDFTHRKTTIFL
jgi:hypothetical protein